MSVSQNIVFPLGFQADYICMGGENYGLGDSPIPRMLPPPLGQLRIKCSHIYIYMAVYKYPWYETGQGLDNETWES